MIIKCQERFFSQLGIPKPDFNLNVGSGTQAQQVASIMVSYEKLLLGNLVTYVWL